MILLPKRWEKGPIRVCQLFSIKEKKVENAPVCFQISYRAMEMKITTFLHSKQCLLLIFLLLYFNQESNLMLHQPRENIYIYFRSLKECMKLSSEPNPSISLNPIPYSSLKCKSISVWFPFKVKMIGLNCLEVTVRSMCATALNRSRFSLKS